MKRIRLWVVLTGIAWALAHAGSAPAQQPGARKPPARVPAQQGVRKPPAKPAPPVAAPAPKGLYETYQPMKRLRSRSDTCVAGETLAGAFCIKSCMRGFAVVAGSTPPRCRSMQPLAEGKSPRPEWKEEIPRPPARPATPGKIKHGAGV